MSTSPRSNIERVEEIERLLKLIDPSHIHDTMAFTFVSDMEKRFIKFSYRMICSDKQLYWLRNIKDEILENGFYRDRTE